MTTENKPIFEYNNRTEQSYIKNKLSIPERLDEEVKRFLSMVEGDIERTITKIIRVQAPDYLGQKKGQKRERKEFLYWYENWTGKDWQGRTIAPVNSHVQGRYYEQETEPIIYQNKKTGDRRTGEHEVYYVPYSKKTVDDIIAKSDNTDIDINFTVKGPTIRNDMYSYEQFANASWDEVIEMMYTKGGPVGYDRLKKDKWIVDNKIIEK